MASKPFYTDGVNMKADSADDLCWHIVTRVAKERDVEPERIDDRLHDVIDIDALAHLVEQSRGSDSMDLPVSFRMVDVSSPSQGTRPFERPL